MRKFDLAEKERIDIEHWAANPEENPESDSIFNVINKVTDMPALLECQRPFDAEFRRFRRVLELGAGQGWASCLFRKLYPQAQFTVSDISEHAVASVRKWEKILDVGVEKTFACRSYEVPAEDASFDCVFTYAAAHHFVAHRRSLREIRRLLKPGGHAFYFHEPACRRWIYRAAHYRVNRCRPDVPEDVIVYPKLLRIAREEGLRAELHFNPTLHKRGATEFLYYFVLGKLPFLQRILPCTATFHFVRE